MNKTLIIGDLHITDSYVGSHQDYWSECTEILGKITTIITEEKVTSLILTGDLVGLREKNLKNRESLMFLMVALKRWNELTGGRVYSVIGNHDIGGRTTDFDLFESLGLVKTTRTLNANYVDIGNIRFHLIDYGNETAPISLRTDNSNATNIGVTHADIQVSGKTTWWYPSPVRFELSSMSNWRGIELIVAGHIHNPSPNMVGTDIDGVNIDLIYPGCPTRPRKGDDWGSCWGVLCSSEDMGQANCTIVSIPLPKDVFVQTIDEVDTAEIEDTEISKIEELAKILSTLSEYRLNSDDDVEGQIKRFSGVDTEAMDLALSYYKRVSNNT